MLSISVLTRQPQMTKEKPSLWPGQICLTRSGTAPGSGLICLTKYESSKIPDLTDLNFLQPCLGCSGFLQKDGNGHRQKVNEFQFLDRVKKLQKTLGKLLKASYHILDPACYFFVLQIYLPTVQPFPNIF